MTCKV